VLAVQLPRSTNVQYHTIYHPPNLLSAWLICGDIHTTITTPSSNLLLYNRSTTKSIFSLAIVYNHGYRNILPNFVSEQDPNAGNSRVAIVPNKQNNNKNVAGIIYAAASAARRS